MMTENQLLMTKRSTKRESNVSKKEPWKELDLSEPILRKLNSRTIYSQRTTTKLKEKVKKAKCLLEMKWTKNISTRMKTEIELIWQNLEISKI